MIIKSNAILKPIKGHWATRGLVAFWGMMPWEVGGTIVHDLSENGNTGIFGAGVASPVWVPGKYGPTLSFDGGDYIDCGNKSVLSMPTHNSFAISVWVNASVFGADDRVVISRGNPVAWLIWWDEIDDVWEFFVRDSGAGLHYAKMDVSPSVNQWYHLIGVWDGTEISIWENGVKGTTTSAVTTILDDTTGNAYIGFRDENNTYFTGLIDLPTIYSRAPSFSEIALLNKKPFCMFEREPIELWSAATIGAPPVGAAGIMTPNTGFWGPTF